MCRARVASGAADVRLPGDPEGAGVHRPGAADRHDQGAGRTRDQVCQGPERQPRRAEGH